MRVRRDIGGVHAGVHKWAEEQVHGEVRLRAVRIGGPRGEGEERRETRGSIERARKCLH